MATGTLFLSLPGGKLRIRLDEPPDPTRQVFIQAGQSNAASISPIINLGPTVPGYAQTDINEWTGAPPVSVDSGIQYQYPTLANSPCLYNQLQNDTGDPTWIRDGWGSFIEQTLNGTTGDLVVASRYGLELSFLQKHLATYPGVPIACVKQALGGSSVHNDWLPNTVQVGVAQAGSSSSITLASSVTYTQANLVDAVIRVTSGTGVGSTGVCTAYNTSTKVATVSSWSGTAPTSGSGYGIERTQARILRIMLAQAAARLDAAGQPWKWAGLIWMQGESGAHSTVTAADDSTFRSDTRALFAAIRSWTRADLPIMVGRIGDNWGWETDPSPYLVTAGYPWAAIDYSINGVDGRIAQNQTTRDGYLAGAVARRASQVALGSDPNCIWWSNDGLPIRPPYSLTAAENDKAAYHYGGPGYMAMGERAFEKYQLIKN